MNVPDSGEQLAAKGSNAQSSKPESNAGLTVMFVGLPIVTQLFGAAAVARKLTV